MFKLWNLKQEHDFAYFPSSHKNQKMPLYVHIFENDLGQWIFMVVMLMLGKAMIEYDF